MDPDKDWITLENDNDFDILKSFNTDTIKLKLERFDLVNNNAPLNFYGNEPLRPKPLSPGVLSSYSNYI